jgi:hypothetical protein
MEPTYSGCRDLDNKIRSLESTFEAEYDVEPLIDMPSAVDHDFHEPGVAPRPDLLLQVTTANGKSWTGGVRAGGPSVASAATGALTTPNKREDGVACLSDLLCMIKHQYHVYSYKERHGRSENRVASTQQLTPRATATSTLADFVRVGEPVVGLEILSDQLHGDEVGIEPAVFEEIEELCRLLGLQGRSAEQLRSRVREPRPHGAPEDGNAIRGRHGFRS